MKLNKLVLTGQIIITWLTIPLTTFAADNGAFLKDISPACINDGNCKICEFVQVFVNAADFIFSIAGAAALVLVLWNGFGMITARGNAEAIKGAQDGIWRTIVGLFMVLFAWQFVALIIMILTNQAPAATISVLGKPWNAITCP